MTIDVHQLDVFVLWGSAVTFLAILAVRVSSRTRLPSLLLYLMMGVALGESGLGIGFEDAELAHAMGFAALVVILAEGGLTTPWSDVRPSMRLGLSLATVGVTVSVLVVAVGDALPARAALGDRGAAGRGHSRRPMRPRCSRCCASYRSPSGSQERSRRSPGSTTPRSS